MTNAIEMSRVMKSLIAAWWRVLTAWNHKIRARNRFHLFNKSTVRKGLWDFLSPSCSMCTLGELQKVLLCHISDTGLLDHTWRQYTLSSWCLTLTLLTAVISFLQCPLTFPTCRDLLACLFSLWHSFFFTSLSSPLLPSHTGCVPKTNKPTAVLWLWLRTYLPIDIPFFFFHYISHSEPNTHKERNVIEYCILLTRLLYNATLELGINIWRICQHANILGNFSELSGFRVTLFSMWHL